MEQGFFTIVYFEDKGERIVFTDAMGQEFSFFKNKKDGQETRAYETWKKLKIKIKDVVKFNYEVNGKYNNAMSFITKGEALKTNNKK